MRDYTYQDMLRMQEEAAVRVREMKKRATLIMDDDSEEIKDREKISKKTALPDEVKHISYPVEIEMPEKEEIPEKSSSSSNGLLGFLSHDKDALLILSLLSVLSETNDYITCGSLLFLLM